MTHTASHLPPRSPRLRVESFPDQGCSGALRSCAERLFGCSAAGCSQKKIRLFSSGCSSAPPCLRGEPSSPSSSSASSASSAPLR